MKRIEVNLASPPDGRVVIGRREENAYCEVVFQIQEWLDEWPGASVEALYWRPDGKMTILASGETGESFSWIPSRTDTEIPGVGCVELRIMSGETLGKKAPIFVMIRNAPKETTDAPDGAEPDWATTTIEKVEEAKSEAKQAVEEAKSLRNDIYEFWEASQPISPADVVAMWNKYF